jgi:hypothetical protein
VAVEAMAQVLSALGAAAILAGFWGLQRQWLEQEADAYLILNLVGAVLLAASAILAALWAVAVLNIVWASVAAHSFWAMKGGDPS